MKKEEILKLRKWKTVSGLVGLILLFLSLIVSTYYAWEIGWLFCAVGGICLGYAFVSDKEARHYEKEIGERW